METASALVLESVEFAFGRDVLFRDVDLELGAHEFVTIMGPNGVGKSTLISLLLGAQDPTKGVIRLWGRDSRTLDRAEVGRKVAWVVSEREFYPPLYRVRDLFRALDGFYPAWDGSLERSLCEGFGIDVRKELRLLSLGECAKVKLIKALSMRPDLLVLDELTANLDPRSKEVITRALLDLFTQNRRLAVLYVSHSDEEALRLSDRIYRLGPHGLAQIA